MWQEANNRLNKEFEFADFKQALMFVNEVGELAQDMNHHPDIFLHDYKYVRITLTTHDTGGVSVKDRELAKKIDKIYTKSY